MADEVPNEKRTSLTRRLCLLVGIVIVFLNVVQLLFVTSNAQKDIVAEDLEMYANMIDGYSLSLQNDLEGYVKELNGYIHADVMEDGDLQSVYEWIQDPEHADMRGEFDYIMFAGPDGISYNDNGTTTDISDRSYFKAIMQQGKEQFIDDPVISKTVEILRIVPPEAQRLCAQNFIKTLKEMGIEYESPNVKITKE